MKGTGMEFTMVAISLQRLLETHKFVIEQPDRQTRSPDAQIQNRGTKIQNQIGCHLFAVSIVYCTVQVVMSLLL
jgi:hypothetical protein